MSIKAENRSVLIEAADGASLCAAGNFSPGSDTAMEETTVEAGLEDALAVLRTAVLLARNHQATLHLVLPATESLEIHFGRAPCHSLLLGLTDAVKRRLSKLVSASSPNFTVEIGILRNARSISIHIGKTDSVRP